VHVRRLRAVFQGARPLLRLSRVGVEVLGRGAGIERARSNAAVAATKGAAIEVPPASQVRRRSDPSVGQVDKMPSPGAAMSTVLLADEVPERSPSGLWLATDSTCSYPAG
jgi:hypothetical protein